MSILHKLVKQIINEERFIDLLCERKRAVPVIMYHGTSSKFLPKIFQLGMIPNPKKGRWQGEEPLEKSTAWSRSLKSLPGSYWTTNMAVAISSAGETVRSVGGERMYVIAQIVPGSGKTDEDKVGYKIERAFQEATHNILGYPSEEFAWQILGTIHADPKMYDKVIKEFSKILHEELKTSDKMPINEELMSFTYKAFLHRILGHLPITSSNNKWKYLEAFERQLEETVEPEKTREIIAKMAKSENLPKFDKISGERKYQKALDMITSRYRKFALPPKNEDDPFDTDFNVRMTTSIGFRGRNKIIGIVKATNDSMAPRHFELVYGTLPEKFIDDYKDAWSSNFKITDKKTGKVIYDQLTEQKSILEHVLTEKMALKKYGDFCQIVANAYEELPDYDPEAVSSYKALISHVEKMYERLKSKVRVEFVPGEPYKSQKEMAESVKETGVLKISTDHNEHNVFTPEQNLKFRAVHNYIVHILANVDFSDKGEVAAFNAHAKLLPPKAIPAAFTEVVGQACYYNAKGSFPKQKIAIMKNFDFTNVGKVKGYDIKKKELVKQTQNRETIEETDNNKTKPGKIKIGPWVYHLTTKNRLKSIAKQGIVPKNWNRIWFAANPGDYLPSLPTSALLRFPAPKTFYKLWVSTLDPVEFYTREEMNPDTIEVLTIDGWVSLLDYLSEPKKHILKQDKSGLKQTPAVKKIETFKKKVPGLPGTWD